MFVLWLCNKDKRHNQNNQEEVVQMSKKKKAKPLRERFLLEQAAFVQVLSAHFSFPLSVLFHQYSRSILIYMLF